MSKQANTDTEKYISKSCLRIEWLGTTAKKYGVSFWGDKNVPKLIMVINAQLSILKTVKLYTLNG